MTIKYKGIHYIQLAAPPGSEDLVKKFYGRILGFNQIVIKKQGEVRFEVGNSQIRIVIKEPFSPSIKVHPSFTVENIEELQSHLIKNNVSIVNDDKLHGIKRLKINDPFGNLIEFLEKK